MKGLEVNVSFIPNLDAIKCTMPMTFKVIEGRELKKVGGVVFASTSEGRPHVLIDKNATKEEAQNMIDWVRRVINPATHNIGTQTTNRAGGAQISVVWKYDLPRG